jgi:hypothetical protein
VRRKPLHAGQHRDSGAGLPLGAGRGRLAVGALGFTPRLSIGDHRAQLNARDGAVVITGGGSADGRARTDSVMIRVE